MAHVEMNEREARTQQTFTALMWALSYPGRAQNLIGNGLQTWLTIGETLIDLETSYYTSHTELNTLLSRLGARARTPAQALYQFYPQLEDASLATLQNAPSGNYLSPDEAATLVIGVEFGAGQSLRLRGPGIKQEVELRVKGLPVAFWQLRARLNKYPMGWDIFLVGQGHVVGLPRTTQIEVSQWRI